MVRICYWLCVLLMISGGIFAFMAALFTAIDWGKLNKLKDCKLYVSKIPSKCWSASEVGNWDELCSKMFDSAKDQCSSKNVLKDYESDSKVSLILTWIGCIFGFIGISLFGCGKLMLMWCVSDGMDEDIKAIKELEQPTEPRVLHELEIQEGSDKSVKGKPAGNSRQPQTAKEKHEFGCCTNCGRQHSCLYWSCAVVMIVGGLCVLGAAAVAATDIGELGAIKDCSGFIDYIPNECWTNPGNKQYAGGMLDVCREVFASAGEVCAGEATMEQFSTNVKISHWFTGVGCILGFVGTTLIGISELIVEWCISDGAEKNYILKKIREEKEILAAIKKGKTLSDILDAVQSSSSSAAV